MFSEMEKGQHLLTHLGDLASAAAHLFNMEGDMTFMISDLQRAISHVASEVIQLNLAVRKAYPELLEASKLPGSDTSMAVEDLVIRSRFNAVEILCKQQIVVLFGMTGLGKLTHTKIKACQGRIKMELKHVVFMTCFSKKYG